MKKPLAVWVVVLTNLFLIESAIAKEARRIVTKNEIVELFRSMKAELDPHNGPGAGECYFALKWGSTAIPKSEALKYLKLRISTDITPSSELSTPVEILGAAGFPGSLFCDERRLQADIETRYRQEFTAKPPSEVKPGQSCIDVGTEEVGFPILNNNHDRALVTYSDSADLYKQGEDGTISRVSSSGGSGILVYGKKNGTWSKIDFVELSNWDGPSCY
ncbi:hypothetical protein ACMDCR_20625 [Labrys okinawensis]|uniref:hypothetical protein n=1 Tax=Labrys okinawensis TaxID=346911 RepID=UPI0039BD68F3